MPNQKERRRLEGAYSEALAAYVELLAQLQSNVLAGIISREEVRRELEASERLDAARREYHHALSLAPRAGLASPTQ